MEAFDMVSCFDDKLLDFDDEENNKLSKDFAEEELEWLSNKDAFPAVETSFVDIILPTSKHRSPISVLDNSNCNSNNSSGSNTILTNRNNIVMYWCDKVPVKARSKHVRKCRDMSNQENKWWVKENVKNGNGGGTKGGTVRSRCLGRKCQHCGAEKTPQWRAGPFGPKTLCNACGVRFKSGRLVPEYRPASSPTYSEELHSNSHRKILEMRKHKEVGFSAMKPMDKG